VSYLASGVDDLGGKLLVLVPNDLAERVLDGRVVAVDKVAVDELHRQTRLACWHAAVSHVVGSLLVLNSPTARLPTMAIFLCLGAGIVGVLAVGIR